MFSYVDRILWDLGTAVNIHQMFASISWSDMTLLRHPSLNSYPITVTSVGVLVPQSVTMQGLM